MYIHSSVQHPPPLSLPLFKERGVGGEGGGGGSKLQLPPGVGLF